MKEKERKGEKRRGKETKKTKRKIKRPNVGLKTRDLFCITTVELITRTIYISQILIFMT